MTECTRCGDCCERIWLDKTIAERLDARAKYRGPHASVDDLVAHGWERDQAEHYMGNEPLLANATFVAEHWTMVEQGQHGGSRFECDAWDRETRLCTAHDDRPPICAGFPWYDEDPAESMQRRAHEQTGLPFSERCSFNADVPGQLHALLRAQDAASS